MWSNLVLSKIIRYTSRQDIYNLCLIDRKSHAKIYKNIELFRALVKIDFNKDFPVGINPFKYYWDNRLDLYGISTSITLSKCLPARIKGDDNLAKVWSGVKFVSTDGHLTGFITADSNLYVCSGPFGDTGFVFLTTNVKSIICLTGIYCLAVLFEDGNLYLYFSQDKFVLVLSNVRHIQKNWYSGFNAITNAPNGGGFYSIKPDKLSSNFDVVAVVESDEIQFSSRSAVEIDIPNGKIIVSKITLKINQIGQNIKFLTDFFLITDFYLITERGVLYRIRDDDFIRFKKLDNDVLFVTRLNPSVYWVNNLNQLIQNQNEKSEIIHTFNHPIISLVAYSLSYMLILDNIGDLYILGRPSFSLPNVNKIKYYPSPILMLKNVRQVDFTSNTFFCIRDT